MKPLTLNQLAIRTSWPAEWLREQAAAGKIPCLRVGNKLLFNLLAVEKAVADMAATSKEAGHAS
jgi:hypothetical protein